MPSVVGLLLLGLAVGLLVGLMGVGGGVVLVPAYVFLLGLTQRMAQGTSVFLLLPPLGLGALLVYRKQGDVDWSAGIACALGFLCGGLVGGLLAVGIGDRALSILFGSFLVLTAALLFHGRSGARPTGRLHV